MLKRRLGVNVSGTNPAPAFSIQWQWVLVRKSHSRGKMRVFAHSKRSLRWLWRSRLTYRGPTRNWVVQLLRKSRVYVKNFEERHRRQTREAGIQTEQQNSTISFADIAQCNFCTLQAAQAAPSATRN